MSPRQSDTRERLVGAAADMLARHGLNATSIREMAKWAATPLGSTYHHFPDGKQQLVIEAVTLAGARAGAGLDRHLQNGTSAGLRGFLAMWREILIRSEFHNGCPVMAVAVEEPLGEADDDVLAAAAAVFRDWEGKLILALRADGITPKLAQEYATLIVASVEGAIVLCRAQRDIAPFDRVSRRLGAMVASAIG
ncbi:TetR/AcrR family transcriptional regulator [Dyella telluris]|uniref:TetR/AcrR family transcriptional regulator n=1 Tax=Dyella telluris TaxID=2763498 RepID=A0A7G8Q1P9_9GAMM|nr:TetR/AcrR family transcriptional regulator [Dyella telluris]QNK00707.1 TetR/AcrR family transcriptional regulator [Dyella telluris]